jgi:hypothetical protein
MGVGIGGSDSRNFTHRWLDRVRRLHAALKSIIEDDSWIRIGFDTHKCILLELQYLNKVSIYQLVISPEIVPSFSLKRVV